MKAVHEKHLNWCYYGFAVHFEFEGIEVATIILFFSIEKLNKT